MKLYGKKPVLERIKIAPQTIKKLYLQKRTDLSEIVRAAKRAGLVFESVSKRYLEDKCGNVHTQGVMAEIEDFVYASYCPVILDECLKNKYIPVFLDGITDPQNLGAIIRSLACLGRFSLVLPRFESANITETVLRIASGGENYLKIAMVTNIARAVKDAKEKGIWIIGAEPGGKDCVSGTEFVFPLAIVIGAEGRGIRPGVRKYLDAGLSLPMQGAPLSYNVAVATALFCYEVMKAHEKKGKRQVR